MCESKYHRRTQQWPYQFDIGARFPGLCMCVCGWYCLCVFLVLSGGDAGVCLSTCCAYSTRACLSLSTRGPQVPPRRLRQCSDRAPKTPMRRSTPSSALSSVVESSQPDDGGRSTTLLLVAFPLPSRSLLAGPDAAISPRTRTKNRLACVIVLSCLVLSRLIFAVPPKKKKEKPNGEHFPEAYVSFARERKVLVSARSPVLVTRIEYTCEFEFQVPVDVRTVVSWGISEELAEPRETGLVLFSSSFRAMRYKLRSPLSQGLRNRGDRAIKKKK